MKIIIDTHIFLWALSEPEKLDAQKKQALQALYNTIYVSSVSIAEMMIKASIGKLNVNFDPVEMTEKMGFELLDFTAKDALLLKEMPLHHKDPFDRMLLAQSITNNFVIMSDDQKFIHYDCKLI
ncbi:MAG: type II toxin-antitoxin system VapC family toxin [Psychrosphaera sp.]|nr:type II toxin-antitoxin system VapC family toxin [Psychrosphaera sp.]